MIAVHVKDSDSEAEEENEHVADPENLDVGGAALPAHRLEPRDHGHRAPHEELHHVVEHLRAAEERDQDM
jgi:hypothetical protein